MSKIEWTDMTWNPIRGCTPVSPGCAHCYAKRMHTRHQGMANMGRYHHPFSEVRSHADLLSMPKRWRKPSLVFVNSMSDTFHEDVPDDFLVEMWEVMKNCPQHTFQVLTKRPKRMREFVNGIPVYPNIWLGVTVCNQAEIWNNVPTLLGTKAAVRFVSIEPMLKPVWIREYLGQVSPCIMAGCFRGSSCRMHSWECKDGAEEPTKGLDWVIVGGETGPGARHIRPDWVRFVRNECNAANVPFFFKGWGATAHGRELDGKTWNQFPKTDRYV